MKSMTAVPEVYGYNDTMKQVILSTNKGTVLIPVHQIIRIQSISNYSKLFLNNGKTLVISKLLRWFELHPHLQSFVRIHRTHLVNIDYIKNYSGAKTGMLFLHNGEIFTVARRKKAGLTSRFNMYNFSL